MTIWQEPLPARGTTTVLEASAGTGKSFTIAGLIARYVAQGTPLDQVLAVTFSRRATAELRESILRRLVSSRAALAAVLADDPTGIDGFDIVDRVLTTGNREDLAARHDNLDRAIRRVDRATMVTLHTFAARMLDELGVLADHDPGIRLTEDPAQLIRQVVADTYLGDDDRWQELDWDTAVSIGEAVCRNPGTILRTGEQTGALRRGYASAVCARFEARKRHGRILTYDDLITRLSEALSDPDTGSLACRVLTERFPVVLVDEFQDTDPHQWSILENAFHRRSSLILIGDPKQAIYRFRGGDIETYARARRVADHIASLDTNHRSDRGVCEGIAELFGTADLGTLRAPAPVTPIQASHTVARIRGPRGAVDQVQVRALTSVDPLPVAAARQAVAVDLLDVVDDLLDRNHEIDDQGWRPLTNGDIAVLVTRNDAGRELAERLNAHGRLAVFTGDTSVYHTEAAQQWLTWLEAMETPDRWHLRRAMLTDLVGWTSADIASGDESALVEMTALLTRCSQLLAERGVVAAMGHLAATRDLSARLLSTQGGEELLSDLNQLTELLNAAQQADRLTPSGLVSFLRARMEEPSLATRERTRRLPTDRSAITVMTVHQSKGLQFPVVLLPASWDRFASVTDDGRPLIGHEDGRRVLDIATAAERAGRHAELVAEEEAESLRLLYVACTRASSLLVTWWAPSKANTTSSPLHRLLMARHQNPSGGPRGLLPGTMPMCRASQLPEMDAVTVIPVTARRGDPRPVPRPDDGPRPILSARQFADHIDRDWVRTSYSALTAEAHESTILAETDEPDLVGDVTDEADQPPDVSGPCSLLAQLPGGTGFGSVVHSVLEIVDPASPRLSEDLRLAAVDQMRRWGVSAEVDDLVGGLEQTLTTPLGVLTGGASLADLGASHRLAELEFELPLGAAQRHTVGDLAAAMARWTPPSDPLGRYPQRLRDSPAASRVLAGFLTGSIDVVLQVPGDPQRYVVLDYKTNRALTAPGLPLLAQTYTPTTMARMMMDAHYPLQALLYCVALHRYLNWRLPGYDPEVHLGGVGYLFVRGMTGRDNDEIDRMGTGVFTWLPDARMILEASEILRGGAL